MRILNLDDIQGNIPRAYGRYSFPFARYFFLHIDEPEAGRHFIDEIRKCVTSAARWAPGKKPEVTLNVALSYTGLERLGLPTRTLQGMPDAFVDGMKARAFVLGDRDINKAAQDDEAWCAHWDPIWRANRSNGGAEDVHVWISMNAQAAAPGREEPCAALDRQTAWLRSLCARGGVRILAGHGRDGAGDFQSGSAVFADLGGQRIPTPKEHFGLTDGIGDPVFAGQYPPEREKTAVIGRGKRLNKKRGWEPLATGEFILGYPDEAQEMPPTAMPPNLMQNGSFMVYRKLHENVGSFRETLAEQARRYAAVMGVGEDEATETLKAKMIGRWADGVPLARVPTYDAWLAFRAERGFDDPDPEKATKAHRAYLKSSEASDFRYADDLGGVRTPNGSHLRRVNTRDYLDPHNRPGSTNEDAGTQLNKRRGILRRGLPYGPPSGTELSDETEQGVVMMTIGANIFRQFEFVQQQWIQYGLDFNLGNNTCPLIGNHHDHDRHVIPSDPDTGKPPYIMSGLRTFVETRGGEYFFIPSLTALQMIAFGIVDPT